MQMVSEELGDDLYLNLEHSPNHIPVVANVWFAHFTTSPLLPVLIGTKNSAADQCHFKLTCHVATLTFDINSGIPSCCQ